MKAILAAVILLASIAGAHAEDRSLLFQVFGGEGHSQHERSRFIEKPPHATLPPRRLDQANEPERYYMTPLGVCGDGGRFGPKFQTGNC